MLPCCLSQLKQNHNRLNRDGTSSFLPGVDASHVYVHSWVLGCFHSLISTQTFRRALTTSVDSCAVIKSAPSGGVTKSGRVWRKVPESDARSVGHIRRKDPRKLLQIKGGKKSNLERNPPKNVQTLKRFTPGSRDSSLVRAPDL